MNTQTVEVEDNILQLNTTQGSPDTATATTSGISIYRGNGVTQASFIFDDADDTWDLTNNLVVDGNVGINETNPSANLHISGSGDRSIAITSGTSGASTLNLGDSADIDAGAIIYDNSNNSMQFKTNTGERMRIDSSGNVSIDRTNPNVGGAPSGTDGRFNVYTDEGSSAWAQQMRHDSTTGNGLFVRSGASSSYYTAYFAGYDESNVHFVVRGDGNVGIGTSSPNAKLDIGTTAATAKPPALRISNASFPAYYWDIWRDNTTGYLNFGSATGSSLSTHITIKDQTGEVGIGVTSPGGKLEVKAANTGTTTDYATKVIKANAPLVGGYSGTKIVSLLSGFDSTIHAVDFGYGYNGTGYDLMLSTNDNLTGNPIERMRIDSGGDVYIKGQANPTLYFQTNSTTTTNMFLIEAASYVGTAPYNSNRLIANNSSNIAFETGGSERMRITSSGNVELKPTNPAGVSGTDTNYLGFRITQTNSQSALLGTINGEGQSSWGGDLIFSTKPNNGTPNDTVTEKMRLTSVGELLKGITSAVGIGATPADANSTEIGNGYINLCRDDTADAKQILFGKNGVRHSFIETTGNGLTFHYGTTAVANLRDNLDGAIWSSETIGRSIGMCSGTNYASGANHAFVKFEGGASANIVMVSNSNGVQLTKNSTSWSSNSDERLKENITSVNNVLDKIQNYRCVEYNFINDEIEDKKIGFIAQDWQEDFPAVVDNNKDDMLTMKYTETIPILLKAIQELKAEVETLKNQINGIN